MSVCFLGWEYGLQCWFGYFKADKRYIGCRGDDIVEIQSKYLYSFHTIDRYTVPTEIIVIIMYKQQICRQ